MIDLYDTKCLTRYTQEAVGIEQWPVARSASTAYTDDFCASSVCGTPQQPPAAKTCARWRPEYWRLNADKEQVQVYIRYPRVGCLSSSGLKVVYFDMYSDVSGYVFFSNQYWMLPEPSFLSKDEECCAWSTYIVLLYTTRKSDKKDYENHFI